MLNLKLAEYNLETGKFERFLELGKDFIFGGDFIGLPAELLGEPLESEYFSQWFDKDEKDPLNRFDGLFNGKTYGNGRFVLSETLQAQEGEWVVWEIKDPKSSEIKYCSQRIEGNRRTLNTYIGYMGNLHENPELWEKICSY